MTRDHARLLADVDSLLSRTDLFESSRMMVANHLRYAVMRAEALGEH